MVALSDNKTFFIKQGDNLSGYEARLEDRKNKPMDLSEATAILMYVRKEGEATNTLNGVPCSIIPPSSTEAYTQRIKGPDSVLPDVGDYRFYIKVAYGTPVFRIPSEGFEWIHVEASFE